MSDYQISETCKNYDSRRECPNYGNPIIAKIREPFIPGANITLRSEDYDAAYAICLHCDKWKCTFQEDDEVRRKSGGPVMTIDEILQNRTHAKCREIINESLAFIGTGHPPATSFKFHIIPLAELKSVESVV
jgi:hypothetical protein